MSNLKDMLESNPFAQKIAGEQAVKEQIARLSPEEQAAAFDRIVIRQANPEAEKKLKQNRVPEMQVYQAKELYGKELERTPMVIPHMLPIGLNVLAGAPKRGKSWLALAMALAVSGGTTFLNQPCNQGDVLYLDLESRQYRVQDRLRQLTNAPAPDGFFITHEAAPLDGGLYEQLEKWIKSVRHASLIIIDTLGRVKASGKKSSENAYESDTRLYGALQKWAVEHKLAVLVVHHLRKVRDSDDWFDKISGSNGLVGVADTVLGLGGVRGEQVSKLMVSGRDIDGDYELAIRFKDGQWSLESASGEEYEEERSFIQSPTIRGVYRMMQETPSWQGTAQDLIDAIIEATGEPMTQTAKDVQRDLITYSDKLKKRYDILAGTKKLKSGKRVLFIVNKAWEESFEVFGEDV